MTNNKAPTFGALAFIFIAGGAALFEFGGGGGAESAVGGPMLVGIGIILFFQFIKKLSG